VIKRTVEDVLELIPSFRGATRRGPRRAQLSAGVYKSQGAARSALRQRRSRQCQKGNQCSFDERSAPYHRSWLHGLAAALRPAKARPWYVCMLINIPALLLICPSRAYLLALMVLL
jgi:hypothetical protein